MKPQLYSDRGSVRVNKQLLINLGIVESIDAYCVLVNNSIYAYLDEACDETKLVRALNKQGIGAGLDKLIAREILESGKKECL